MEIQKTNLGIRIRILEIQLKLFELKFAQKWVLGLEFQTPKSGFGITTCKISCEPIFSQNEQLLVFQPKFGEITCNMLVRILLRVLQRVGWRLK